MVTLSLSNYIISNLILNVKLFSAINLLIGKGIEPHPTDGHQCFYASLDLSNDIETHGASTISTPCLPCGSSRFASPLSTQHNYYIKTQQECQVFSILFLFYFKGHKEIHGEHQAASSVTSSSDPFQAPSRPCPVSCSTSPSMPYQHHRLHQTSHHSEWTSN